MTHIITSPIPPLQNLPINAQFYEPSNFVISNISTGQLTTVTTSINHNYVIGQLVRLVIPKGYGCGQLNEQTAYVISIPSATQVMLNLYSFNADPFISASLAQKPQINAVGGVNYGNINATGLLNQGLAIPGSFQNISPL